MASSAGTRAVIGHSIHEQASRVLEDLGGDPRGFVARQLTARIISDADLILTMTEAHRDRVLELAPHKLKRTFLLTEASRLASTYDAPTIRDLADLRPLLSAKEREDVVDPINQSADVFAEVGAQIADLISPVLHLCERSSR